MPADSRIIDINTCPHSIHTAPFNGKDSLNRAGLDTAAGDANFYRWSQKLSARLTELRRDFGGDLDLFLLQLVFVQAEMSRGLNRSACLSRGPGLNALSVADITAISRETTRRKLKVLADGGFLQRGPDGLHYLSERYSRDHFAADFSGLYQLGGPPPGFA
ncbi:MAG TPA: hypothetical protein VL460_04370 [Caulobacteraceae bacterium]|jgi:hypothetical protein|nr:hypothetical protein [Caulobacteraceae bacterium]